MVPRASQGPKRPEFSQGSIQRPAFLKEMEGAARALRVAFTIPPSVLVRADQVID
jgi:hypothetical protein